MCVCVRARDALGGVCSCRGVVVCAAGTEWTRSDNVERGMSDKVVYFHWLWHVHTTSGYACARRRNCANVCSWQSLR
jgi:hypothetical protein